MSWVVGIDPGATGAFAFFAEDGTLLDIADMPVVQVRVGRTDRSRVDLIGLRTLVAMMPVGTVAYLEQVGPSSSAAGSFTFGRSVGVVEGMLAAYCVPVTLVSPQRWQPPFGVKGGKAKSATSRAAATRLFPDHAARFVREKDNGRSDSCLIGLFGIRHA